MAIAAGIFRQYDIRGIVDRDLTTEAAHAHRRRVRGVPRRASACAARSPSSRDNRPSGAALRDALVDGLTDAGVDVVDIGVVPTPLNYWALHHLPVVGGIQITGSHNPPEYNGFKLSRRHRRRCTATRSSICTSSRSSPRRRRRGAEPCAKSRSSTATSTTWRSESASSRARSASCTTAATAPVRSSRRSCSRGSAWRGSRGLFCESDGTFPNHHPDPTVPENLEDLIARRERGRRRDRHRVRRRRRPHRRRRRQRRNRLGRPDPHPLRARRACSGRGRDSRSSST